ncbi:MAG: hypothetical protein ABFS46_11480 [Myxococcota bacterium]
MRAPLPLVVLLLAPLSALAQEGPAPRPVQSRPVQSRPVQWVAAPGVPGSGGFEALAVDAAGERVALGDERGVLLGSDLGTLVRRVHRGPVRDIVFLPDGTLLAATGRGLFHLDAEGRVSDRTPGPGARDGMRLATRAGRVAVATGGGAYVSSDGARWHRVDAGVPLGPAQAVAFGPAEPHPLLFVVVRGELWRTELGSDGRVVSAQREGPFPGQVGRAVRDVTLSGDRVLALTDDALLVSASKGSDWRVLRPALPPGAEPHRIVPAAGSLWIATERGLVRAERPEGPWRRTTGPAARSSARALAVRGSQLYAATRSGLLVGTVQEPQPAGRPPAGLPADAPAVGPPVGAVQRAALAYLDLDTREIRRMREGLRRRGWLPELEVRLAGEQRRIRSREGDQIFSSGALHQLYDLDVDRTRDYGAGLVLSWDFGDLAFHPEQIDVSREAREVVELRDDVLDQVNQLYFERVRVILDLETRADDPAGTEKLRVRATELGAGLDAWTGGWFSRQLAPGSREPNPLHPNSRP